jgi:CheY-like chemotaxis protein
MSAIAAGVGHPPAPDILVAEDNEVNQLVFRQILEQLGHGFQIVGDGRRAVEAWRTSRPRVILMDVSMPEMNGLEATAAIRAAEAAEGLSRTPIIGVTAHALKGDRERCLEAGMDDYLTKPVSPQRIAAKLAEWMGDETQALRA